ncbi:MAG: hypothetical protein ACK4SX_00750 [Alcanivoracaceae bacterium]
MRPLLVLLVIGVLPASVAASSLSMFGSLYGERQSNITSSTFNPESGAFSRLRLEANGEETWQKYAWNLNGQFSYQHYDNDRFSKQFFGNAFANARWFMVPQALEWNFDYIESLELIDPAGRATFDNERSVRVFGSGPVIRLSLLESNELVISLRRQRIEGGIKGYYRNIGDSTLFRQIRPRLRVFAGGGFTRVEYGDSREDFSIRNAQAGYIYDRSRFNVRVEGGRSWLDQEFLGEQQTETGAVNARWLVRGGRSLAARSQLRFGDEVSALQGVSDELLEGVVDTVGAFREESHEIVYSGSDRIADPVVRMWHRERRYQRPIFASRDTRESGIGTSVRLYNADVGFVMLLASAGHRDFLNFNRLDRDHSITLRGTRLVNPRNEFSIGTGYFERDSTVGSASYSSYSLFIEYRGQL